MELQLHGEEVHVIVRDSATLERARRVLDRAGGPVKGNDAAARGFVAVWHELQNSLGRTEAVLTTDAADQGVGTRGRRRRKPPA
jgi:hypothetical protein